MTLIDAETTSASRFRDAVDNDGVLERLLSSSEQLSYDPNVEVDWDAPIDPLHDGVNPEWCTLYGTDLWDQMTPEQRATLTRHEAASVASIGIWFEMILQQLLLEDIYAKDYASPEFQFALTEIADECRHSIMFARGAELLAGRSYLPHPRLHRAAKLLKFIARGEVAFTSILVAEEVLDVMQRDWMRGETVAPQVKTICKIHVVEESRHMKFARHETIKAMEGVGRVRREASAALIATIGYYIVKSLVRPGVYEAAGLDVKHAREVARNNTHHQALMRLSCVHLMDFLSEAGLLTPFAKRLYRRVHML
ncbi:diiron oxygenase [Aeromicrobium sp. CTD01-1L150]|uniref:AurF N-oxygenase family protein n=1 Tax=Aeromicrobium sp. CTD01-1L150 TaxID=3341830 RepID=UPI0035C25C52